MGERDCAPENPHMKLNHFVECERKAVGIQISPAPPILLEGVGVHDRICTLSIGMTPDARAGKFRIRISPYTKQALLLRYGP
jgi:hypothetical protein